MIVRIADRHVGWRRDGEVVATVRLERDGDELTVAEFEGDARELFDAIVQVGTAATRLAGDDAALAAYGFEERDGRWVRDLTATPDDHAARAVTLGELEQAIRASWTREISESPDTWSDDNPAYGCCAVTAMVVRDYLGGDLVIGGVVKDGVRIDRHVWNVLPSGLAVDLSRDQFRAGEQYEAPQPLNETTVPGTTERYELLAARGARAAPRVKSRRAGRRGGTPSCPANGRSTTCRHGCGS